MLGWSCKARRVGKDKGSDRVHRTASCIIQFFRIGNKGETVQFYILTASRILESPT